MIINLQVEFDIGGENIPSFNGARMAGKANKILHDYEDGRYPFCVEMLQRALGEIITGAIRDAALDSLNQQYGGEKIQMGKGSTMSKAYYELEKFKFHVSVDDEETRFF